MSEKKKVEQVKAPNVKVEKKPADVGAMKQAALSPENRANLKLFEVKRNEWGTVFVAARNPREARAFLSENPHGYNSLNAETRIGRAKAVPNVAGDEAFRRGAQ